MRGTALTPLTDAHETADPTRTRTEKAHHMRGTALTPLTDAHETADPTRTRTGEVAA